jgi:hypothetical protein
VYVDIEDLSACYTAIAALMAAVEDYYLLFGKYLENEGFRHYTGVESIDTEKNCPIPWCHIQNKKKGWRCQIADLFENLPKK